jgi:hypothetical protein
MSDDREFLRATTDWLEAGSDRTPPGAVNAVLLAVRTTRQDRVLPVPWRPISMQTIGRVMIAAAAVVAVSLAWINFSRTSSNVGIAPLPTSTLMPSPTPIPADLTSSNSVALDPGTRYVTASPFPIRVTFAAPAGWSGNLEGSDGASLGAEVGNGATVRMQLVSTVYADPCHSDQGVIVPALGPTADDLVSALTSLPGLNASTPSRTTFGGLPATALTLTPPGTLASCTYSAFRVWHQPSGYDNDVVPGETQRVWILDVQGKRLVVIAVAWPGATEASLAETQQVLDSILIESPAG